MSELTQAILETDLGIELGAEEAATLAGLMQERTLKGGDYLFKEGTSDAALHLLLEGNLEVVKKTGADGTASIAIIRHGQLAGELSFIDGANHTVGLRALSESRIVSLPRAAFEGIVDTEPQLVYKVMRAVARSAHRIMHQMNDEFIELSNYIFKQHGRY